MHRIFAGLLVAAFMLIAANSSAQAQRDPAAAEVLFEQGREAMKREDYDTACAKFAESQRLEPAAGTLMNLATCEQSLGLPASAWHHWREALDLLAPTDNRVTFVKKQLADLKGRLPYLTISVAEASPERTVVERDGVAFGQPSWGEALPVDPGEHTIVARAPGYEAREYTVTLKEGEQKSLTVTPGEALPPEQRDQAMADISAEQQPEGLSLSTVGWIVGGVGVAGAATGAVTGLMVQSKQEEVEENCPNKQCTSQEDLDAASDGETLLTVNTVSWIVGAAGIGTGVLLILLDSDSEPSAEDSQASIVPLPGGLGFSYSTSF